MSLHITYNAPIKTCRVIIGSYGVFWILNKWLFQNCHFGLSILVSHICSKIEICKIRIKLKNTRRSVKYGFECTHVTLMNLQTTRTRTWTPRTEVPWPTVTRWMDAAQKRTGTSPADSIWLPTWELIVSNNRPLALTMECLVFCWSSTRYNLIQKG